MWCSYTMSAVVGVIMYKYLHYLCAYLPKGIGYAIMAAGKSGKEFGYGRQWETCEL